MLIFDEKQIHYLNLYKRYRIEVSGYNKSVAIKQFIAAKLMRFNPFRDRLMTTQFDVFRSLVEEINDLKADLKTLKRRVNPPFGSSIAYRMIKQVSLPLSRVFNSRKYTLEKCLQMFKTALIKLDLLIRELTDMGIENLADTFSHIYRQLFNLLPENTLIQPQLFDIERYQTSSKKPPKTEGFLQWLQDYVLLGYQQRDINRRMWGTKPPQVVQKSLRV